MEREFEYCQNETCGKPITSGRSDKAFCDGYCRTEQNKRLSKRKAETAKLETTETQVSLPSFIHGINDILANNRRILDECLGSNEKCTLKKRDIDGRGFRFKFFTSCDITASGEEYYFCYDLGYKVVEEERLVIVRRPREATY